jgi:uncharacterized small protein (DUF1192 family)
MAMLLVRIGLGVGVVLLAEQWPAPVLLSIWAMIIWLVPRAYRDYREVRRLRALANPAAERVKELETDLILIRETNVALLAEIEQLQAHAASTNAPNSRAAGHPLFRRVGLDQDAPKWVIEAVRKEYRKRLHPDAKPPGQKVEAERRFKEMEAVFAEIWTMRGF